MELQINIYESILGFLKKPIYTQMKLLTNPQNNGLPPKAKNYEI